MSDIVRHEGPERALAVERARNARLLNSVRFFGVSAFYALFVVLGGILRRPEWQGNLGIFSAYFVLSAGIYFAARRRDRVALALSLALAFIDMPVIFFLQWAQFPTSNASGVAGFNVGVYVFLLVLGTLSLERWKIFLAAAMGIVLESILQVLAHVSPFAIAATALLLGLAAFACVHGSERLHTLIVRFVAAEEAKGRSEKLAAIGQLAGSIGHDLRNPLAALRMAHEYMDTLTTSRRFAELPDILALMQREIDICFHISDGLLDYARERPLKRVAGRLFPLVREALDLVEARKPPKVTLTMAVPPELSVELDHDLFRQALVNLVQNAAEAIPAARIGRVEVAAHKQGHTLIVTVSDNGEGIPDSVKDHMFEPLFTTKTQGTGFGLAVVAGVLKRHGAELAVETKLGEGTTFTIRMYS